MKNKQKPFNNDFKLCGSAGSSLVQRAGAQATFHLYAVSLLKDKLAVVRKNICMEPCNDETLLWMKALAGA